MTRRQYLRWLPHNLIGHGLGYCLLGPVWPPAGKWLHDLTLPPDHDQ